MIKFLAKQKFRFDLGISFMSVVNFAFIVIAASDKLALVIHTSITVMLIALVPGTIFAVWFFGYILDKCEFFHAYKEEQNDRNKLLQKLTEK